MIRGHVNDRLEIRVQLTVHGPNGQVRIDAIVDTGFDESPILPATTIRQLGLPWLRSDSLFLADGDSAVFDVYDAAVICNRRRRRISVHESDADPLIGTELLEGYALNAEFEPGGLAIIRSLKRRRTR